MAREKQVITVWIPGNQLMPDHPALLAVEEEWGQKPVVLMVESARKLRSRRFHSQKLVLVLSAMRHYAQELQQSGYRVDYIQSDSFLAGFQEHRERVEPDRMIVPSASDRPGRHFQAEVLPQALDIPVELLPNPGFLVDAYNPYPDADPEKRVMMEHFYRRMRRHFGILVDEEGEPEGGEWNYDRQNRKPLPEDMPIPDPLTFSPDQITREVMSEVSGMTNRVGDLQPFQLAVTSSQAEEALEDFIEHRLVHFGAYEDAMTARHPLLFHSRLSPYLNLGILNPLQVINRVLAAYQAGRAPLNSVEGFVRQVLGWREYMYWQYWRVPDDFSRRNSWQAVNPLPDFFWTGKAAMNCLRHALRRVLETGYTHHIERLMVITNYCTLAGIQPGEVLDWFMACGVDAYPWVMVPNVIGMGLNADGGLTATKPYISSANYIHKMSDYCPDCDYQHRERTGNSACPYNYLYWHFLDQHEERLRANPRMGFGVYNLRHLAADERDRIRDQARTFLENLTRGDES